MTSDPVTAEPGSTPPSLADRLSALRQQAGLSSVFLFRITSGRNGQRMQCLLRFPVEEEPRLLGRSIHHALRVVSDTAAPFITVRRARGHRGDAAVSERPTVLMIAPVFTFEDEIWGAVLGISAEDAANGAAFRSVIQAAAQIGGQVSSWGRPRTSSGPAPVQAGQEISMTSSAALLHELRTPLTASGLALEVLDHGHIAAEDEAGQRALRNLRLGLEEAVQIVRWWEEAQRKGQVEAHPRPISIETALRQSLALSTYHTGRVHVSIGQDTPLAFADEMMLHRVFLNLIENAFLHGQPGGVLEISTAVNGTLILTRFLNEGVMSDASMRHILNPSSTDSARSEERGHGYGLGIVKALLHSMGGSLQVETDEQHWTAFTVRLLAALPEDGITVD